MVNLDLMVIRDLQGPEVCKVQEVCEVPLDSQVHQE